VWRGGVRSCGCLFVVLFLSCCCVCDLFLLLQGVVNTDLGRFLLSDSATGGLDAVVSARGLTRYIYIYRVKG